MPKQNGLLMKRLLILLFLLPVNLFAQLKIVGVESPLVEVAKAYRVSLDTTPVTVDHERGIYRLRGATTNRFDIYFSLELGRTKEEALNVLRNLASLCDQPVGTFLILKESDGEVCDCRVSDLTFKIRVDPAQKDKKGCLLKLNKARYHGEFIVTKKNLKTLAKQVERYNEE